MSYVYIHTNIYYIYIYIYIYIHTWGMSHQRAHFQCSDAPWDQRDCARNTRAQRQTRSAMAAALAPVMFWLSVWVMAHVWMGHCTYIKKLWHTCAKTDSLRHGYGHLLQWCFCCKSCHVCMSHVTYAWVMSRMHKSWHMHEWVIAHISRNYGTHAQR